MDGDQPTTAERTDDGTEFRTRSRRVSFAETTDVRFFNSDDDHEIPPNFSTPATESSNCSGRSPPHFVEDQRDHHGSNSGGGDESEEQEEHEPFVKNVVDSSPGSMLGSATSNEDYNLFGPVSSSFIKTGRSDASDSNNHDITLDSETFSMHFRNIIPYGDLSSCSMENLKTPTGDSVSTIREGTLIGIKKKILGEMSSPGLAGLNSNSGTGFITPNSNIGFHRLPSKLEALLVKVNESQTRVSPGTNSKVKYSSIFKMDRTEPYDSENERLKQTPNAIYSREAVQNKYRSPGLPNFNSFEVITLPISSPSQITKKTSTESHLTVTNNDKEIPQDVVCSSEMFPLETPSVVVQKSPEQVPEHVYSLLTPNASQNLDGGSISSSLIKHQDLINDSSISSNNRPVVKDNFCFDLESIKHSESLSTIRDSISKYKSSKSIKAGVGTSISFLPQIVNLQPEFEAASENLGPSPMHHGTLEKNMHTSFKSPKKGSRLLVDADLFHPVNLRDSIFRSPQASHRYDSNHEVDNTIEVADVVKKRNIGGLCGEDFHHLNESDRIRKVRKIIPEESSTGLSAGYTVCSGGSLMGDVAPVKHWNDIFLRVSEIASKPLPDSINILDLEEIVIFVDKLSDLQRTRKFERLYMDIQLMTNDRRSAEQRKRLSEVKLLQDIFVYEKARLLLVKARREKLRIKRQCLRFEIEECNKLRNVLNDEDHIPDNNGTIMRRLLPTSAYSSISNQVEQNKLTSAKQDLQNLEMKLKHLKKQIAESCNVKETANFDEIIDIASEHLKKKNSFRFMVKKLLLWELIDVINDKDQCHVLLSYQNLLKQRYTIKAFCGSSLFIRNLVDVINVEKRFPNMGACTAFKFIFPVDNNCNLSDSTCFRQETQRTSFVIGNLLNVLKEVQAAWLDIANLASSIFYRRHSRQLELELTFINLNSGVKVVICMDMTNLKRGIYPSDPSELRIQVLDGKSLQPSPIASQITTVIHDVKDKYSSIMNLCRRVSYTVQSSQELIRVLESGIN